MMLGPAKCFQDECFPYETPVSVGSVGEDWQSPREDTSPGVGDVRKLWTSYSPLVPTKLVPLQNRNNHTIFTECFAIYKSLSHVLPHSILVIPSSL